MRAADAEAAAAPAAAEQTAAEPAQPEETPAPAAEAADPEPQVDLSLEADQDNESYTPGDEVKLTATVDVSGSDLEDAALKVTLPQEAVPQETLPEALKNEETPSSSQDDNNEVTVEKDQAPVRADDQIPAVKQDQDPAVSKEDGQVSTIIPLTDVAQGQQAQVPVTVKTSPDTPAGDLEIKAEVVDQAGKDPVTQDAQDQVTLDQKPASQPAAAPAAPAQAPVAGKVVSIESFTAALTRGASPVDAKGDPVDDRDQAQGYLWTPKEKTEGHMFVYTVTFSISGVDQVPAGGIKLYPKMQMLHDKDGSYAQVMDVGVPKKGQETDSDDFVYEIVKDANGNDQVVVTNIKPVKTGNAKSIDIGYATSLPTTEYRDMGNADLGTADFHANSDVFSADLQVDIEAREGQPAGSDKATVQAPPVTIDTGAQIKQTEKQWPTFYEKWQDAWGTAVQPANPEDYYYVVWPVITTIDKPTQYYDFTLNDRITQGKGGLTLGFRMQDEGASGDQGQKGAYTAGTVQADGSTAITVNHISGLGDRYDYVLTVLDKSKVDTNGAVSQRNLIYYFDMINEITATVHPADGVDEDTSAVADRHWWHEQPLYPGGPGSWDIRDYGIDTAGERVKKSEQLSNYKLDRFQEGKDADLGPLTFENIAYGYPWPFTLADPASDSAGTKAGDWYKSDVAVDVYSNEYSIGSEALQPADYDLTGLNISIGLTDADFDETAGAFGKERTAAPGSDETYTLRICDEAGTWHDIAKVGLADGSVEKLDEALYDQYVASQSGSIPPSISTTPTTSWAWSRTPT